MYVFKSLKNSPTANAWRRFCQTLLQWIHCRVVSQKVEPTNIPNSPEVTEKPYNTQLNQITSVLYVLFIFNSTLHKWIFFSLINTSSSKPSFDRWFPMMQLHVHVINASKGLIEIFSETRNEKHQIKNIVELLKTIMWSKQFSDLWYVNLK